MLISVCHFLFFILFHCFESRFFSVSLAVRDPPATASLSAGITGVCHHARIKFSEIPPASLSAGIKDVLVHFTHY